MRFDLDDLPSEPTLLQHLVRDPLPPSLSERAQFGRRSERLDPDQLALALEDVDSDLAREEEKRPHGEIKPANGLLVANRCPPICRAKRSASTLRA